MTPNNHPPSGGSETEGFTPMTNNELVPVIEAIALIDEINERAASRAFHGINQPLHAKLCTIRATLHRTRTASGEGLRKALERISSLTPHNANAHSAEDFSATVRAIADTALADHSAAPPSELREALEKCRAQFDFYAREHRSAQKFAKAETNQQFADMCAAALKHSEGA